MSSRLAKVISNSGYCSRRDAEKLILERRVAVDGKIVETPALNISEENIVTIDGKQISETSKPRLWLYYKPVGLVTTHKDPENRPTVFTNLPKNLPRVISVGRLDLNSEGLLLLTNSGDLARKLELPSNNFLRIYKVRTFGKVDMEAISKAKDGVNIEGIFYKPKEINLLKSGSTNNWFEVHLTEGKNREIRKIFTHFGLKVNRLIRISYGPFSLGKLNPGDVIETNITNKLSL
ncbi:MAG: rRNA pseudouridine synthase [Rickettsiaceae bacterium]|nr:rRNA pseudouridine synthase [Rickettsiaceae bacterium]